MKKISASSKNFKNLTVFPIQDCLVGRDVARKLYAVSDVANMGANSNPQQSSKNTQGKPTQIFVQRLANSVTVTLWPVPDSADTYTLSFFRIVGIAGMASGIEGATTTFIPPRFVPLFYICWPFHKQVRKVLVHFGIVVLSWFLIQIII